VIETVVDFTGLARRSLKRIANFIRYRVVGINAGRRKPRYPLFTSNDPTLSDPERIEEELRKGFGLR